MVHSDILKLFGECLGPWELSKNSKLLPDKAALGTVTSAIRTLGKISHQLRHLGLWWGCVR